MGIRISSVGSYVPEQVVTNRDLVGRVDTSPEWIETKTGIVERRIAGGTEAPSDMAKNAAIRCLARAGVDKSDVDLIIVATASPDQIQPAVACLVQDKLGISAGQCPAFDVNSVCAGFVFALNVAQGMMADCPSQFRRTLVIGTDAFSKILDWTDRRTCVFFGDGAGAVLLSQSDATDGRIRFLLGSDGRGARHIEVPAGGTRWPVDANVLENRSNKFRMDGPKVWEFAVRQVPVAIRELLDRNEMSVNDVDLLILHQSNLRMIEAIMSSLELPMERTVTTLEHYGNTAAASIPLTLDKAVRTGRLRGGERVVLCGFGGGLSWGSAVLEW